MTSGIGGAPGLEISGRSRLTAVVVGSGMAVGVAVVIGFALGRAIDPHKVSDVAIQNLATAFYLLCPIAIAHGVLTSLVDRAAARSAGVRLANPWRVGAVCAVFLGLPAAMLARPLLAVLCPFGATPAAVAVLLAAGTGPLAMAVIGVVTSSAFTPVLQQRRPSPVRALPYLIARHVVPVGLFNAVANLAAAFALFPGSVASGEFVVLDAAATFSLIALFVGLGTVTHARGDLRSGLVAPLPREAASKPFRSIVFIVALTLTCTMATWLTLGGGPGLSLVELVVWRAVAFGAFAAVVALLAARWTLATAELHPKRAAL